MDSSFVRSYSPVPPPCPSPQLKPQPLPTPPVYARRQSLTPSHSSRDKLKIKPSPAAAASSDSLVFSLKDAIVAGSPSSRRYSDHAFLQGARTSDSDFSLDRRPRTADMDRSFASLPSPVSPNFKRKHRRSNSITHTSELYLPLPPSHSLARKRTRSPSGRPLHADSDPPPPVPPLPPLPPKREGCTRSFLAKKLPPIRIPELGLGLDEKLRSPLSPLLSGTHLRRRKEDSEATSFLHMSSKRDATKRPARASVGGPLMGCISLRTSRSLPDIKTAKHSSLTSRILRLGTHQVEH